MHTPVGTYSLSLAIFPPGQGPLRWWCLHVGVLSGYSAWPPGGQRQGNKHNVDVKNCIVWIFYLRRDVNYVSSAAKNKRVSNRMRQNKRVSKSTQYAHRRVDESQWVRDEKQEDAFPPSFCSLPPSVPFLLRQLTGLSLVLMSINKQISGNRPCRASHNQGLKCKTWDLTQLWLKIPLCFYYVTQTEPHRTAVHVTMEAEIRVMKLQAEKVHGLPATPEAGERHEIGSPSECPEVVTTLTSYFWPPKLWENKGLLF